MSKLCGLKLPSALIMQRLQFVIYRRRKTWDDEYFTDDGKPVMTKTLQTTENLRWRIPYRRRKTWDDEYLTSFLNVCYWFINVANQKSQPFYLLRNFMYYIIPYFWNWVSFFGQKIKKNAQFSQKIIPL